MAEERISELEGATIEMSSPNKRQNKDRENEENLRNLREQYPNVHYTHNWSSRGRGEKIYI